MDKQRGECQIGLAAVAEVESARAAGVPKADWIIKVAGQHDSTRRRDGPKPS